MNDAKKQTGPIVDPQNVEWGETKQERIVDKSPHAKSESHDCKGPACTSAFEKL